MFNKVILIGRAGQDIDIKITSNGSKVAKFTLATSRSYMDSHGNWQEKTEWHNIALWGRLADKGERIVRKGHLFFVEGTIEYQTWEDVNGNKKYRTEIRGLTLIPLTKKTAEEMTSSFGSESAASGNTSSDISERPQVDDIKEEAEEIEDVEEDIPDSDIPF